MTNRTRLLLICALLTGCSSAPRLTPWQAQPLVAGLPAQCADIASVVVPGGLAVVRSDGSDVALVATRGCVMIVNAGGGTVEPLPTRGDSIAPTMVDATSGGLAFSSSLSGSVRVIDTEGAIALNMSGLRSPAGLRLLPGGTVLVAEQGAGRVLRLGPTTQSRPRVMMDNLEGPTGLAVADATTAYVTEALGGRLTLFRLDRFEKKTLAEGLARPEGLTRMRDGRLAVVETGLRRLIAVNPDNGKVEVLVDNLPVGALNADGTADSRAVADVAAVPDGSLLVSGNADRSLLRVTPRPVTPR